MTHARDIAAVYAEEAAALAALEAALADPAARQRLAEAIIVAPARLVNHTAELDPGLAPAARALQAWLRHHIATHSAALVDAKRAEVLALADQLRAALDREDLRPPPPDLKDMPLVLRSESGWQAWDGRARPGGLVDLARKDGEITRLADARALFWNPRDLNPILYFRVVGPITGSR